MITTPEQLRNETTDYACVRSYLQHCYAESDGRSYDEDVENTLFYLRTNASELFQQPKNRKRK